MPFTSKKKSDNAKVLKRATSQRMSKAAAKAAAKAEQTKKAPAAKKAASRTKAAPASKSTGAKVARPTKGVRDNGLKVGDQYTGSYKKRDYHAEVYDLGGRSVVAVKGIDGTHTSLSAAGKAVRGSATNGLKFWRRDGEAPEQQTSGRPPKVAGGSGTGDDPATTEPEGPAPEEVGEAEPGAIDGRPRGRHRGAARPGDLR